MNWYRRLADRCGDRKVLHERNNPENVYLVRYTVFKRRWIAAYLHQIVRSDDAQDCHDHPWAFFHVLLEGHYEEQYPRGRPRRRGPGSFAFRRAKFAHRLELERNTRGHPIEVWTLVVIGPKVREWGFIDRLTGCWTQWRKYVDGDRCGT